MPSPESNALGFGDALLGGVLDALDPLLSAAQDPVVLFELMDDLGWVLPATSVDASALDAIAGVAQAVGDARTALDRYRASGEVDESTIATLVSDVANVIAEIATLANQSTTGLPEPLSSPEFWAATANELAAYLLARYLRRWHPFIHALFRLFGILDREPAAASASRADGHLVDTIRWDRLAMIVTHPDQLIADVYGWGTALQYDSLVRRLRDCLVPLGVMAFLRVPDRETLDRHYGPGTQTPSDLTVLRAPLYVDESASSFVELGFEVFPVPAAAGSSTPVGLLIGPYGSVALTLQVAITDTVSLAFGGTADGSGAVGALVRPGAVEAFVDAGALNADLRLELAYAPPAPRVLIGDPSKTGVSIAGAGLSLELVLDGLTVDEAIALIHLHDLKVSIDFGEGDGFLSKVTNGVKGGASIDGAIGWSSKRGIVIEGAVGLELTIPLDLDLGPLTLSTLVLGVRIDAQAPEMTVAIAASLALGPIAASVDGVGVRMRLEPRADGPVFGLAPIFAFKPPEGLGLAVGAGPVGGGGYVFFDPQQEQYAGVLQLSFEVLNLTAVGLLTTRMPDGSKGFSLLVIITAQFPPIQLGYGFTLNGVGGLLGVNRTMVIDVLRNGIRNRTLDAIMFPPDPIRNAPQIVSDLGAVFPPAEGRYTFGPMVMLGWGSPTLLRIEVGLILELPSPVRLVVLGKIILALPAEEEALVYLRLDVVGAIDFDRQEASVDASLVDSRVVEFPITGDMAMRLSWGPTPTFALAAGGFHPSFQPPPGFPDLARLAISLSSGDNPRIRLESYFALTANTLQLGARAELYAEANLGRIIGTFSVSAYVGFDTLIHFSPFEFSAAIGAGVTINRNGSPVLSATLAATLTGPSPWHAWGYAEFVFLGTHRVQFDATIGPGAQPAIVPVAVLPLLREAVASHASWSASLPPGATAMVSLRDQPASDEIRVHPLGSLTIRQRVVPLATTIDAFGSSVPSDGNRFELTRIAIAGVADPGPQPVMDRFAPAQFLRMTDDEKLARPSFEQMPAGAHVTSTGVSAPPATQAALEYEQAIVDVDPQTQARNARPSSRGRFALTGGQLDALTRAGAAAGSPAANRGSSRFAGPEQAIGVPGPSYVVADAGTLRPVGDAFASHAAASEHAAAHAAANPRSGPVVVVRAEEAA